MCLPLYSPMGGARKLIGRPTIFGPGLKKKYLDLIMTYHVGGYMERKVSKSVIGREESGEIGDRYGRK